MSHWLYVDERFVSGAAAGSAARGVRRRATTGRKCGTETVIGRGGDDGLFDGGSFGVGHCRNWGGWKRGVVVVVVGVVGVEVAVVVVVVAVREVAAVVSVVVLVAVASSSSSRAVAGVVVIRESE